MKTLKKCRITCDKVYLSEGLTNEQCAALINTLKPTKAKVICKEFMAKPLQAVLDSKTLVSFLFLEVGLMFKKTSLAPKPTKKPLPVSITLVFYRFYHKRQMLLGPFVLGLGGLISIGVG